MIKVITTKPMSGLIIPITPDVVDNYDILDGLSKTKATDVKVVTPDGVTHDAKVVYDEKECRYFLVFKEYTVVGKGSCIEIDQNCTVKDNCGDGCAKVKAVLTDDTKIPVLDENGCPTDQFTTLKDIKKFIIGECLVPDGIMALSAGDRIVAIDTNCKFKGISPNSLCCTDGNNPVDCNSCP